MKSDSKASPAPPANPQGKGLTPVLSDWRQFRPHQVVARTDRQLLADYFTSMLVLSADFRFRPVVGQSYYLYLRNGNWHLSLIEPERWQRQKRGDCLGECQLHADMTWSIQLQHDDADPRALQAALHQFAERLQHHVQTAASDALLPHYVANLPYYRRLAASGLASALEQSSPRAAARIRVGADSDNWRALIASPPASDRDD